MQNIQLRQQSFFVDSKQSVRVLGINNKTYLLISILFYNIVQSDYCKLKGG